MKKFYFVLAAFALLSFFCNLFAQEVHMSESLFVNDTRDANESPSFYQREIRADLKQLSAIGISTAFGFSTNLTIAPWADGSAGYFHQLNFNNYGIYYRNGDFSSKWNSWRKLLVSDINGDYLIGDDMQTYTGYGKKLHFGTPDDNLDNIYFVRNNVSPDKTELRLNLGDDYEDKFVIGRKFWNEDTFSSQFVFKTNGCMGIGITEPTKALEVNGTISSQHLITDSNICIGTADSQGYALNVNGAIHAQEIVVDTQWADFVFKKGYNLPSLQEVEQHISENGTLPGVPSEEEVKANGIDIAKVNVLLLQKIEELTLYVIRQQKEIDELKSQKSK